MQKYRGDPEHEFLQLIDFFEYIPIKEWADDDQRAKIEIMRRDGRIEITDDGRAKLVTPS